MEQNIDQAVILRTAASSHTPVEMSSNKPFIEANTLEGDIYDIRDNHVIPVWLKDNEPLISHAEFIEIVEDSIFHLYQGERVLTPSIRLSHPIKGRIPSAKDKPAHLLNDLERTIFYERMMFVIEIPSITANINGNILSLTVGGVKSFGEDNLYQRSGGDQHFKLFIGFQNRVCTNLCVWTDGYISNISVKRKDDLVINVHNLFQRYNSSHHLYHMSKLAELSLTENQFATLIGRCRMYQYLPDKFKQDIPRLFFGENQLASVVRDYYRSNSFCREEDGRVNLWKLYNLFTGANKSSYIDSFLDRSVNAYSFVEQIRYALEGKCESWYLM